MEENNVDWRSKVRSQEGKEGRQDCDISRRSEQIDADATTFRLYISINCFVPQLASITTKQNPCPRKPQSFLYERCHIQYLSHSDSLVITPAELVPLKIPGPYTVIYRIEMCLEMIQH